MNQKLCRLQKKEADYPIYLTRDPVLAKGWRPNQARGTGRFDLVASSGAQRLRPEGIYIKARIQAVNWFLNDKTDLRSYYYLEDVASEFAVPVLELDLVGAGISDFGQVSELISKHFQKRFSPPKGGKDGLKVARKL